MLRKSVDFVSKTITRDDGNRAVVQGDFLRSLWRVSCMWETSSPGARCRWIVVVLQKVSREGAPGFPTSGSVERTSGL